MTSDQSPTGRNQHDRDLQTIIDSLATSGQGRPLDDLARELEQRLADRGLPEMPAAWIRAVTTQAAVGNPYVVSRITVEDMAVPDPKSPNHPFNLD